MKKMLFIMNPCSGTRKANKVLADILNIFNRADYTVEVYMTACRGDATRVAQEKADQFDIIVCCGGDGTFSETMSGILRAGASTPIGYIPAGSTNDFAVSLGLPTNLLKAAEINEDVITAMEQFATTTNVFGVHLQADYNFTNTATKQCRYQAVYEIHYKR